MRTLRIIQILNRPLHSLLAAASLAALSTQAQTLQCVETNGVKFYLLPQVDGGLDVLDTDTNGISGIVLADDFFCNTPGPITDIHVWGSFLSDIHGLITNVWLGIYDDVPAVTNFAKGTVTPSHPGTNLLWHQIFGPGDFAENLYGTGSEGFFDPATSGYIGSDTKAYYYCFYPTNPFVQTGTRANPTNFWLAAYVKIAGGVPGTYGWKTSVSNYNDGAVWGTVLPTTGLPAGDWQTITNSQTQQPINLSFKLNTPTNPPVQTPCTETNGVKYVQGPDLYSGLGADVWNCSLFPSGATDGPWWLGDDFICTNTGPITDIHLWGSWQNDVPLVNTISFQLYILDNVPAVVGPVSIPSHPGTNILWHQTFVPGSYAETIWANNASEYFMDPGAGQILGGDSQVWYYCFHPTNLVQFGTVAAPQTNWLVAFAELPAGVGNGVFGWKTTTNVQNDISVHMKWDGFGTPPNDPGGWLPNYEFSAGQRAVDLAFKLNTATNPPTQTQCVETNGVKYLQTPNLDNGLDVWNNPYVLADDFLCTNSGPISDIHIWGSWLNNQVGLGTITFWLAIYDDVPLSATNTAYSYPGKLLWQQWFAPGQYAENPYATGLESFLDPGPPVVIGTDNEAWYYCFYPTNPLVQLGSTTAPKTYWLAAYAQLPSGSQFQYGWKTTQFVKNDVSVHAPWPGTPPLANPGWTPTLTPPPPTGGPGTPLDLAFKITTPTNHCAVPVNVLCPGDKTVECGSAWIFDPPLIGPDACCSSNPAVTFTTVTNFFSPCQQSITRTYYISDCIGFIGTCSQTVTVEDTNPPVFTSFPTNLVAYTCDTNIPVFWFITATDACSSVTITSTPPSNFPFPALSTNTVAVTARDACGNTTNKSFTVTVARPALSLLYIRYLGTNSLGTNNYVITWTNGILQVSTATNLMYTTNVVGTYVDVPGATSPYTNFTTVPAKFYRLRCN